MVASIFEGRMPQLIVFDLDYTLWPLWIDTHVTGPLRRDGDELNRIVDRYDEEIAMYQDVPSILRRLQRTPNVKLALASRTHAPGLARRALELLLIPPLENDVGEPIAAKKFFHYEEIYPGSKLKHFKSLHHTTKIPYEEMLFFDDEPRNREVESLGVTFTLVKNGLTLNVFESGINQWRKLHPINPQSSDS
ncbi:magnesium-dependent phosphatase-1 [Sistotremastrum niveocremeum HHB9708]|uniref:Magnesium-dependent phosphatase-1 n=2 Tax=Sistotremastraceae TaxID=3402574 RepID=A0A164WT78_9AGAM|nr:magnesium-dependent phosphatase-1 [Sistotremastrum niveocremeum HHB9708]KZT38418.1 magnesium-dependent phosphatase-1 [Sistotremastrum suecicum HHB10207 ss-3]